MKDGRQNGKVTRFWDDDIILLHIYFSVDSSDFRIITHYLPAFHSITLQFIHRLIKMIEQPVLKVATKQCCISLTLIMILGHSFVISLQPTPSQEISSLLRSRL